MNSSKPKKYTQKQIDAYLFHTEDLKTDKLFDKIRTTQDVNIVVRAYDQALDKRNSFPIRFSNFIRGETKLSRGVGSVLDFATIFLPYGNRINNGRDALKIIAGRKQKQTRTSMPILKDKPWYQSKTMWSVILIAITAILQALGVSVVENSEAMDGIYRVLYTLSGSFGLYGLRDAVGKQIDK